jgi:hypothetical protein
MLAGHAFVRRPSSNLQSRNSSGLDDLWSDPNHGANSLTAGRSHIIRTSLTLLASVIFRAVRVCVSLP